MPLTGVPRLLRVLDLLEQCFRAPQPEHEPRLSSWYWLRPPRIIKVYIIIRLALEPFLVVDKAAFADMMSASHLSRGIYT
jgi:hypothetical protein